MKFEEFEREYGESGNVKELFSDRHVLITDVICGTGTPALELEDTFTRIPLPPLRIWDNNVLIGLLVMADEQGVIDLDAIDIDPDNLDETIRLLIGYTLQMPVRLDQLEP